MVKFCPECNNLFGHKIDEKTNQLIYNCMVCGKTEEIVDKCITVNELDTQVKDYPLEPNMIHDKTYPRTQKIPCPNPQCPSKEHKDGKNPEIIIFQYNATMLKTAYMCVQCHTYWKN